MPSFDIISELNDVELRHAVENTAREIGSRFDFRNVYADVNLDGLVVTLKTESEFQVRQLEDMFRNHCAKRGIDASCAEISEKPIHSGKFFSLVLTFKQGIEQEKAKEMIKLIKEKKLKVSASIQGDKIRVNGKNRDDLQHCIALLKASELNIPLEFNNFRD